MTNPSEDGMREKARDIAYRICACDCTDHGCRHQDELISVLESFAREAVERDHERMSAKQTAIYGESTMLNGRWVTNEELYKQPVDYIREARKEALEFCAELAAEHNGCVDKECLSNSNCGATISNKIYGLISKDGGQKS